MLFSNTFAGFVAITIVGVSATGVAQPAVTATSSPFKVSVGADGLTYTPNNIVAEVGTQIEFSFFPKNHTVTQSSFKDPCHPLSSGGFFSGFVPTTAKPSTTTFTITVEDTKPIWFYCSQTVGAHCQKGMVGAINAPTTGNTLDAFILLASNATQSTAPPGGPAGGSLVVGSGDGTASATGSYTTASAGFTTSTPQGTGTPGAPSGSGAPTTAGAPGSTATSPPITPANGASSFGSSPLFGLAVVMLGALALM